MIIGWLFDIYCLEDRIILLVKTENKTYRIEKLWTPSFYVSSDNEGKLKKLEDNSKIISHVKEIKYEQKIEKASDKKLSNVLKITVKNSKKTFNLQEEFRNLKNMEFIDYTMWTFRQNNHICMRRTYIRLVNTKFQNDGKKFQTSKIQIILSQYLQKYHYK